MIEACILILALLLVIGLMIFRLRAFRKEMLAEEIRLDSNHPGAAMAFVLSQFGQEAQPSPHANKSGPLRVGTQ